MIGITNIISALKTIIGGSKKGLNVELPLTAATPIKLATAIELAKNTYKIPPKAIPFVIVELAEPPNLVEKPVFNFRLLEKELPDVDSINERLNNLEKRVENLEKEVKKLKKKSEKEEEKEEQQPQEEVQQ